MIRLIAVAILLIPHGLFGQLTAAEKIPWVGDTPAVAPPLATDLSPQLTRKNVSHAMQKVADWQLNKAEPGFNQDWTFAALYTGFMAVPKAANGEKYQQAMLQMAKNSTGSRARACPTRMTGPSARLTSIYISSTTTGP
jgi:hypothetical protein